MSTSKRSKKDMYNFFCANALAAAASASALVVVGLVAPAEGAGESANVVSDVARSVVNETPTDMSLHFFNI